MTMTIDQCKELSSNFLISAAYIKQQLEKILDGTLDFSELSSIRADIRDSREAMIAFAIPFHQCVNTTKTELRNNHDVEGLTTLIADLEHIELTLSVYSTFMEEVRELLLRCI